MVIVVSAVGRVVPWLLPSPCHFPSVSFRLISSSPLARFIHLQALHFQGFFIHFIIAFKKLTVIISYFIKRSKGKMLLTKDRTKQNYNNSKYQ